MSPATYGAVLLETVVQFVLLVCLWRARARLGSFVWFTRYLTVNCLVSAFLLALPLPVYARAWAFTVPMLLLFLSFAVIEASEQAIGLLCLAPTHQRMVRRLVQTAGFVLGSLVLLINAGQACRPAFWVAAGLSVSRWLNGVNLAVLLVVSVGMRFLGMAEPPPPRRHRWLLTVFCFGPLLSALFNLTPRDALRNGVPFLDMGMETLCCLAWIRLFVQTNETGPAATEPVLSSEEDYVVVREFQAVTDWPDIRPKD